MSESNFEVSFQIQNYKLSYRSERVGSFTRGLQFACEGSEGVNN
jgi:hypothetical protein